MAEGRPQRWAAAILSGDEDAAGLEQVPAGASTLREFRHRRAVIQDGSLESPMKRKSMLAAGLAVVLAAGTALAAGIYEGYPNNSAALTGSERWAVDTLLSSGQSPQTENITTGQMATYTRGLAGNSGWKNLLIGGDFNTNPWQRGTTSGDIANTLTYQADRWWNLGGASSAINVTKQTGASDIIAGTGASLRFQRKAANADTTAICMGQALTTPNSLQMQGQRVVLSYWALKGANFSPAASNVTATIGYGTGSSESAANFAAGTWTGYTAAVATSQVITTTWTQYTTYADIPATATQVGVKFCFTPVGTAGANDWAEFAQIQLEIAPSGVTTATTFERRSVGEELDMAQRYFYQVNEGAATVRYWSGLAITTSTAHIYVTFPTTMWRAPTTVVATVGTFTCVKSDGTTTTGSALASVASSMWTGGATLLVTVAATPLTAGNATALLGGGGSGVVSWSAEL